MSQAADLATAWRERAQLHYLDDEDLERVVARVREISRFLGLCGKGQDIVPIMIDTLTRDPGALEGEPIEPAVRALVYLAQHGIPDVPSTAH